MNDETPTLREWLDSEIEHHQFNMDSINLEKAGEDDQRCFRMHNIAHLHLTRLRNLLPANAELSGGTQEQRK